MISRMTAITGFIAVTVGALAGNPAGAAEEPVVIKLSK